MSNRQKLMEELNSIRTRDEFFHLAPREYVRADEIVALLEQLPKEKEEDNE